MSGVKNEKLISYLDVLVGIGAMTAVVVCPVLPIALFPILELHKGRSEKNELKRIIKSLSKRGYISVEGKGKVGVTEKGNLFLKYNRLENLNIKSVGEWDRKWRIVIFDIPEEMKLAREYFRKFLRKSGFKTLQKSVLIFPYPCEDEVREAAEILGIWEYVNLIRADKVDREEEMVKLFNL